MFAPKSNNRCAFVAVCGTFMLYFTFYGSLDVYNGRTKLSAEDLPELPYPNETPSARKHGTAALSNISSWVKVQTEKLMATWVYVRTESASKRTRLQQRQMYVDNVAERFVDLEQHLRSLSLREDKKKHRFQKQRCL